MSLKETRARIFLRKRKKMLVNLDIKMACKNTKYDKRIADSTILLALHKARYEATDIPARLRLQSRDWLVERNFSRMVGEDFLPGDELPE